VLVDFQVVSSMEGEVVMREISKFIAGFAANQLLTHGAMAATDTEFTMLGFAYTREFNAIAAALGRRDAGVDLLCLVQWHGTPRALGRASGI